MIKLKTKRYPIYIYISSPKGHPYIYSSAFSGGNKLSYWGATVRLPSSGLSGLREIDRI